MTDPTTSSTPTEAQTLARSLYVYPEQAVAAIAARQNTTISWSWMDVYQQEHARTFTISRLVRADLLQAIHDKLAASVRGDLSRTDWIRDVRTLLQQAGWWGEKEIVNPDTGEIVKTRFDNARLQLIFDINIRQSYAAGQWESFVRNADIHPYLHYITMRDDSVRAAHAEWDNLALPVHHPFWRTHYPPNGWRCRCRVEPMSQKEYERGTRRRRAPYEYDERGHLVRIPPIQESGLKKHAPPVQMRQVLNRSTGQMVDVPVGIDPGFAYNPGRERLHQQRQERRQRQQDELIAQKTARLNPAIAQAAHRGRLTSGIPHDFSGQRPGLFQLPPVRITRLDGQLGELDHKELVKAATAWLKAVQIREVLVNDDTGWVLSLNHKSLKKIADNTKQTRESLQAVHAIEQLVKEAVVVENHPDTKHANENVLAIYRLYAPVLIDGKVYRVKLTVKDLQQDGDIRKLLHALDTVEIENAPLGTLLSPQSPVVGGGTPQPTTERMGSIADAEIENAPLGTLLSPQSPVVGGGTTQPTTERTITIQDLLRGVLLSDGQTLDPDK